VRAENAGAVGYLREAEDAITACRGGIARRSVQVSTDNAVPVMSSGRTVYAVVAASGIRKRGHR